MWVVCLQMHPRAGEIMNEKSAKAEFIIKNFEQVGVFENKLRTESN